MKHVKGVIDYIRKNKLRFLVCSVLELLFIIGFVILVLNYDNSTRDANLKLKEILNDAAAEESPIMSMVNRESEIPELKEQIEAEAQKFVLGIVIMSSIVYGLFFTLVLTRFRSWFILRFIVLNSVVAVILALIFDLIFELKESANQFQIISDKSIISGLIFILIMHLVYFLMIVVVVEMRKGSIKEIFFRVVNQIHKRFWILIANYFAINIIWLLIFMIMFYLMVGMITSILAFFLSILIGLLVLVPYSAASKIYLIKCIKN